MQQAILLAKEAAIKGDVPVGALVVDDSGTIVGMGANLREQENDPTAHAEIVAIRNAANKIGKYRLDDLTMVVTLEPCGMCAGAIALIAIEDEFVIIARAVGDQMQMMISDITYALDYEVAAELIEVLDLEFPEEEDEAQPGGDLDLLNDLGVSEMELLTILDDSELYPDEQLEAIARRLGFGEQFNQVIESN